jgi:lipid-A-disaccharide synthase
MKRNNQIMIVAGEPSGDIHGGRLCRELKNLAPELELFGMGGARMEAAGVDLVQPIGKTGVVGFWEVYKDIGRYRKIFHNLVRIMEERKPRAVILIDYPGFNLRFARQARRRGIRVIYYISPQLWAWGKRRIKKVRRFVDLMVVIFGFEKEFYRRHGVDAVWVGHPLAGTIDRSLDRRSARKILGTTGDPVIGLLPGSRKSEIEKILPILLEAAGKIRADFPRAEFLLPIAAEDLRPLAESCLAGSPVPVRMEDGSGQEIIAAADLLLAASGTVTLEAALFATPLLIVYKLSFLSWLFARLMIRIPHIGLVNIVAGREVVPEFIQHRARPERIARAAGEILNRPAERERMIGELKQVAETLGAPGSSRRAAEAIWKTIANDSDT